MEKKNIIVVCGPTACKKSDTAVGIAKKIGGEIISADSMQIYKYLDIGTAKPSVADMGGIKHHLIDELYPDERFSAVDFKNLASEIVDDIIRRGKTPIVAGGTGFYINALLKNTEFEEMEPDFEYRRELSNLANERGSSYLYKMLRDVDPDACVTIHENNIKRVIRALEYYKVTKKQISSHNALEKARGNHYNGTILKLCCDRDVMYKNIELRVDKMVSEGLFDEVESVLKRGYTRDLVSMQGIGYKEVIAYFEGECGFEDAVTNIKTNTRRFAKRQMTWFNRQIGGDWFDINKEHFTNDIFDYIQKRRTNIE